MFNVVKVCFIFDIIKVVLLKLEIFEFRVVSHSCIGRISCFYLVWIFPHVEFEVSSGYGSIFNSVDHMGIRSKFHGPYTAQGR